MHFEIDEAINLLKELISTPSTSGSESGSADILALFFSNKHIPVNRLHNNIWVSNKYFDKNKQTVLLNTHHDTVPPNKNYTIDPYDPVIKNDQLYGLGSNDAGGGIIALLYSFLNLYSAENLKYNIILVFSAEEEISGQQGITALIDKFSNIHCAIIAEPTQMKVAVAEKGLMVLDCETSGDAGHVAHSGLENAIYKSMPDIYWFQNYRFPKESKILGPVKMTVSAINGGVKHNMNPEFCTFIVDVRTVDPYSNEQILEIIQDNTNSEINARSTRLQPSFLENTHAFYQFLVKSGYEIIGSPTLSDQALMPFPSVKLGPGNSKRSHTADEYIELREIKEGLKEYKLILENYLTSDH